MSNSFLLLPYPQRLQHWAGNFRLKPGQLILLNLPQPQTLRRASLQLQEQIRTCAAIELEIRAGTTAPHELIDITLAIVPGTTCHSQGYELLIHEDGVRALATTAAGLFYAVQTLCQLIQQHGPTLPLVHIEDWPDFPNRGVMLDISRNRVPTMKTLLELIDLLASWKVNQFQLYTEHTFAYRNHPAVWKGASPLTGEDILLLDAYCQERFIDLVPNQNSLGHMDRWLRHARYRPLAEVPTGGHLTRWGYSTEPCTLTPIDPRSLELVCSLYDELLPYFTSPYINVGCDEPIELGLGRSRRAVEELGIGRVYLSFLLDIVREVKIRGRTIQFWDDIIIQHPQLVEELPHDIIALEWGYEANHPFDEHGGHLSASNIPFYVCPGTSTWNSIAGRTNNALENLRSAARNGLKHGAIGFLNTDWGDYGHWQPLAVSYQSYAYGAAIAWADEANREVDIATMNSRFAFNDPSGAMGQVAYHLGNSSTVTGVSAFNAGILFILLQCAAEQLVGVWQGRPPDINAAPLPDRIRLSRSHLRSLCLLDETGLLRALDHIDNVMSWMPVSLDLLSSRISMQEYHWAADLLRHACNRGLWLMGLARGKSDPRLRRELAEDAARMIEEFSKIWLVRSRPGGMDDSVRLMEAMRTDYL